MSTLANTQERRKKIETIILRMRVLQGDTRPPSNEEFKFLYETIAPVLEEIPTDRLTEIFFTYARSIAKSREIDANGLCAFYRAVQRIEQNTRIDVSGYLADMPDRNAKL